MRLQRIPEGTIKRSLKIGSDTYIRTKKSAREKGKKFYGIILYGLVGSGLLANDAMQ